MKFIAFHGADRCASQWKYIIELDYLEAHRIIPEGARDAIERRSVKTGLDIDLKPVFDKHDDHERKSAMLAELVNCTLRATNMIAPPVEPDQQSQPT